MDLRASSLMSFVPWVVMAVGSTSAGLLADGLVSANPPTTTGRKWTGRQPAVHSSQMKRPASAASGL
jgi:hypothetical protein